MDIRKNESFKVGDLLCTPQNEKYQFIQRINSKKKPSQEPLSTLYDHLDTFIVKRQSNKIYYIMKRFELLCSQKLNKESQIQSPSKEKNITKDIKAKILFHPNLLAIEEVYYEKQSNSQKLSKNLILIEEYCQEGDLAYFIKHETKKSLKQGKKETFHEKIIGKWLLQILLALEHLHFNKSTHQILNPNNIYLTPLGNLKINEYYLLNSIVGIRQVKKAKEQANSLIEGYEPMVNQKKFKLNQKKDIFDFGILISYLCNSKIIRDPKKQVKSKNFCHLPSSYSMQLDTIYLNCINVKKTGIQIKDILKTQYFLEVMRQFIVDKKLNVPLFQRIPIKKYTIHKLTLSPKSVRTAKKGEEKSDKQTIQGKLPKIQKKSKPTEVKQSNRKNQKNQPKQECEIDFKKAMRASLQKLKNKLQNHKQKLSSVRKNSFEKAKEQKHDIRKVSRQKPKILIPLPSSKESGVRGLLPPPALPKNRKTDAKSPLGINQEQKEELKSSRQQKRSRSGQRTEHMSRSQSSSPQKIANIQNEHTLTPQITFGKKIPYNQQNEQNLPILKPTQSKSNAQAFVTLSDSRQTQLERISQNLAKIFADLKIREDDEEELSFELDEHDQEELRLTLKGVKQETQIQDNLMKTYKSKFDQMVSQLQEKYQPNLETIIQRTNQWDSSEFFINRELLKRLKIQEDQPYQPSQPFQTFNKGLDQQKFQNE